MGSYVTTFSVQEDSEAEKKLKQWRRDGVNVSARLQMIIEEDDILASKIDALQLKLYRIAWELEKDGGQRITFARIRDLFGEYGNPKAYNALAKKNEWVVVE
jgi:hypothetical protein